MIYDDFKREVQNSRPRLALELLIPVLDDLMSEVAALKAKKAAASKAAAKAESDPAPAE